MNKLLASSVDPEKLSLTVKGVLGGAATLILLLATSFGVSVSQGDLQTAIDGIGDLIVAIGGIVSTAAVVYGAVRKIVVAFKKRSGQ